jgi:hypothetical protein
MKLFALNYPGIVRESAPERTARVTREMAERLGDRPALLKSE